MVRVTRERPLAASTVRSASGQPLPRSALMRARSWPDPVMIELPLNCTSTLVRCSRMLRPVARWAVTAALSSESRVILMALSGLTGRSIWSVASAVTARSTSMGARRYLPMVCDLLVRRGGLAVRAEGDRAWRGGAVHRRRRAGDGCAGAASADGAEDDVGAHGLGPGQAGAGCLGKRGVREDGPAALADREASRAREDGGPFRHTFSPGPHFC